MIDLPEHLDNTSVVDPRNHDGQKIGEQSRLLLQVERKGLVITMHASIIPKQPRRIYYAHLDVGHANNNVLKLVMLPCIRRTFNHS